MNGLLTEVFLAMDGNHVLSRNGLILSSMRSPVREAEKWLSANEEKIKRAENVIILGLGCGYHIAKLLERYKSKKLLAVDFDPACISFFQQYHPTHVHKIQILDDWRGTNLEYFAEMIRAGVSVVHHRASQSGLETEYAELADFLLARTVAGLQFYIGSKFNRSRISSLPMEDRRLLTVKDVVHSSYWQDLPEELKAKTLVVKELVR